MLAWHRDAYYEALNSLKYWVDKFNAATGINLKLETEEPFVFFNKSRLGGYVWPHKYNNRVFLNGPLFLANKEKYHNETIPHEVAHLFQNVLYPKDSTHGIGWQKLMRLVGLSPKRCHNYDITVAVVTFKYICACRKHEVSKVIHNKMVRGQRRICCKCRSTLVKL